MYEESVRLYIYTGENQKYLLSEKKESLVTLRVVTKSFYNEKFYVRNTRFYICLPCIHKKNSKGSESDPKHPFVSNRKHRPTNVVSFSKCYKFHFFSALFCPLSLGVFIPLHRCPPFFSNYFVGRCFFKTTSTPKNVSLKTTEIVNFGLCFKLSMSILPP